MFCRLYDQKAFTDDTLSCVEGSFAVHKVILMTCSPIFNDILLLGNLDKHPIIFLGDISPKYMKELVSFMYRGEINIHQNELSNFLKLAKRFKIKGLYNDIQNTASTIIGYGPPTIQQSTSGPPIEQQPIYGQPIEQQHTYGQPKEQPPIEPRMQQSTYGPPIVPQSTYGPPIVPQSTYGPPIVLQSTYRPPMEQQPIIPTTHRATTWITHRAQGTYRAG
ncbi:Longitudinals lacking protein-like 30 [Homarus americanus]|uniref:Longitudinals lacking protein-like 29 n=1 Tax=Homarus americanus TaxID=6706 RepID=A0A8J5NDA6_HOMAM|nr:Longitudinals lacking protein-like 29 [Homarus americanus]KAG7177454.1 Longitudinals lacking protein-like 30 [Homarus americanus]